jgi:RNA polymerase sigma factor (sigma-70 family)
VDQRQGGQVADDCKRALTPAIERALGRQWVAGRQAEAELRALQAGDQHVTAGQRARLQAQAGAGRQARAHLITACTPIVEGLARQYGGYNIPYEDLVQEGWVGVVRAAATFDPAKGVYFSRHAAWGARKTILDALTCRSRLIRLPAGIVEAIRRISAACRQWELTEVTPPGVDDLAQRTGLAPERVCQVLDVMEPPLSLDAPERAAAEQCLGAAVPDERLAPLENRGFVVAQRQEVWAALAGLDPLARQVVVYRFGLGDGVPRALDEVAILLRLSEGEVRALETAALDTLRGLLADPAVAAA